MLTLVSLSSFFPIFLFLSHKIPCHISHTFIHLSFINFPPSKAHLFLMISSESSFESSKKPSFHEEHMCYRLNGWSLLSHNSFTDLCYSIFHSKMNYCVLICLSSSVDNVVWKMRGLKLSHIHPIISRFHHTLWCMVS